MKCYNLVDWVEELILSVYEFSVIHSNRFHQHMILIYNDSNQDNQYDYGFSSTRLTTISNLLHHCRDQPLFQILQKNCQPHTDSLENILHTQVTSYKNSAFCTNVKDFQTIKNYLNFI